MFNIVEKNQRVVKTIMIVVTASFVLWGVGNYLGMMGDDGYIAKVGSQKIYERDIDNVMQQNTQYTDKMQVLYSLINRQLLLNNAKSYNLSATTNQLQQAIANIPAFQESGVFSLKKYEDFLKNSNLTANQFQNNMQEQIVINQILDFFKNSYFNSNAFDNKFAELLSQERNISTYTIDPKNFYSQIKITDKQINDYYNQNISKFTTPEQVKLQYITLSPDTINTDYLVSESQINLYIATHESELKNPQVDVSHILIAVPNEADAKTQEQKKSLAEKVLVEVKANPKKFAELAKKYSEDPSSAKNGGDLGFFGHGAMVPAFDKTAFKLKVNEISGLVKTQFGYHILKLNARKEANPTEIKQASIKAITKQQMPNIINKKLELLNELTYNKPSSLEPAAKALGINIESSGWISKNDTGSKYANPKIQKAIFSDNVLKKHNNSDVIDLGNNTYTAYRVTEHKDAIISPIESVKTQIVDSLKQQQALELATKEAQNDITKLNQNKLTLNFTGSNNVNLLSQNSSIDQMSVKQIFSTSIAKLPAYTTGVTKQNQVVIYKINKETINKDLIEQNKKLVTQANTNNAMLDFGVYLASLRSKFSVSYKADRLTNNNQIPSTQQ